MIESAVYIELLIEKKNIFFFYTYRYITYVKPTFCFRVKEKVMQVYKKSQWS